jgi:hypothetical protein
VTPGGVDEISEPSEDNGFARDAGKYKSRGFASPALWQRRVYHTTISGWTQGIFENMANNADFRHLHKTNSTIGKNSTRKNVKSFPNPPGGLRSWDKPENVE